jgi:hypothetical protein
MYNFKLLMEVFCARQWIFYFEQFVKPSIEIDAFIRKVYSIVLRVDKIEMIQGSIRNHKKKEYVQKRHDNSLNGF